MSEEKIDAGLSFAELDLAPELLQAVRDAGYTHPTPIQQQAIPLALAGRDLIGLAQTGTGKTAGFTLPIVQNLISAPITDAKGEPAHRVRVLILTPTRELAAQVEESFRKYGKYTQLMSFPFSVESGSSRNRRRFFAEWTSSWRHRDDFWITWSGRTSHSTTSKSWS